jgi:REP element-mobilizing transposase RayT
MDPAFEHSRKTLRLPQHDYAGGVYYVTQATRNRQRLFGSLVSGRVRLSPAGQMVCETWLEMPGRCPWCEIDAFIVMPDHIHFIVRIQRAPETSLTAETNSAATVTRFKRATETSSGATLFEFMRVFKSLTTTRFIHGVTERQWPSFEGKVWQREYYERIVRHDEKELGRIREYIKSNPANADVLRFGDLQFIGDTELLKLRKTAFLASRTASRRSLSPPPENGGDELRRDIANAQCVISGFLSPLERDVFRFCTQRNIPTIHVLARGYDEGLSRRRRAPPQQLIVTPFDSAIATINQPRAAWCNQFAMETADEIVIGHLNPEGLLAFQLSDLPRGLAVTIWKEP